MEKTLYQKLREIEEISYKLQTIDNSARIDIAKLQGKLFQQYESNPVLYDATQGRKSIEDSLIELGKINKGFRKILPRRKNKEHNERLKHLWELVSEPLSLRAFGIYIPDNLITVLAEGIAIGTGFSYLFGKLLSHYLNIDSDMLLQQNVIPSSIAVIAMLTPFPIFIRSRQLPIGQAKYLDEKIQEFYRR